MYWKVAPFLVVFIMAIVFSTHQATFFEFCVVFVLACIARSLAEIAGRKDK